MPYLEGFRLTLTKDVTESIRNSTFTPILPLKSKVTVRPIGTNIVFSIGILDKVMYSVTNLQTEVTQRENIHYEIPELEPEDGCFVRYVIQYDEHPYINIKGLTKEKSELNER